MRQQVFRFGRDPRPSSGEFQNRASGGLGKGLAGAFTVATPFDVIVDVFADALTQQLRAAIAELLSQPN